VAAGRGHERLLQQGDESIAQRQPLRRQREPAAVMLPYEGGVAARDPCKIEGPLARPFFMRAA